MHNEPSQTIEGTEAHRLSRYASIQAIALIALATCLFAAATFGIIAEASEGPLTVLLAILASPLMLLFGWFCYPVALLLVALMWSCYMPHTAPNKGGKLFFLFSCMAVGSLPFLFFFRTFGNAIDPLIGALCGALGGALIIRKKKPHLALDFTSNARPPVPEENSDNSPTTDLH